MDNNKKAEVGMFVGHRTYAPRESWLYKGMKAVVEATNMSSTNNPFLQKDAAEQFGIGRSMVAAVRFWIQVTGLVEERTENMRSVPVLTPFGKVVWEYDRYLEQSATLCWMHYHVIRNKTLAPAWYWFYNYGPTTSFTVSECLPSLWHWAVRQFAQQHIWQDALQRDLTCLLRMYVPRSGMPIPEDLMHSPFSRLQMILRMGKAKETLYQRLPLKSLHPLVPLALLLDQQSRAGRNNVSLSDALYQPMSVGRCFNLSAPLLLDILAPMSKWNSLWRVQVVHSSSGYDLLSLPPGTFLDVVQHYYNERVLTPTKRIEHL